MNALSLRNLRKTYNNGFEALKGIDLDVEAGDFFALLGPNGAGKSTAIGIISSLVNATSGSVSVFGHDLVRERGLAKTCIGLVPQEIILISLIPLKIFCLIKRAITVRRVNWRCSAPNTALSKWICGISAIAFRGGCPAE